MFLNGQTGNSFASLDITPWQNLKNRWTLLQRTFCNGQTCPLFSKIETGGCKPLLITEFALSGSFPPFSHFLLLHCWPWFFFNVKKWSKWLLLYSYYGLARMKFYVNPVWPSRIIQRKKSLVPGRSHLEYELPYQVCHDRLDWYNLHVLTKMKICKMNIWQWLEKAPRIAEVRVHKKLLIVVVK